MRPTFIGVVTIWLAPTASAQDAGEALPPEQRELLAEAQELNREGNELLRAGKPAEAAAVIRKELATLRELYPDRDHPTVARSLADLGFLHQSTGDSAEALKYYHQALEMRQRLYPKQDRPDIALLLNNIGYLHLTTGRGAEGLPYFEKTLAMRRRLYAGRDHVEVAMSLDNLGVLLRLLGRADEARGHQEDAVAMYRRLQPDDGGDVDQARCLNNLGSTLQALGRHADAVARYQEALEIVRGLFPDRDHPEVARALGNMGVGLKSLGRYTEALPFYEQGLAMSRQLHRGRDHPELATSVNNMGLLLEAMGDRNAALPYYREALEMRRRLSEGRDHPDLASSLNNMAYLLQSLGRGAEALPFYEEALAMRTRLATDGDHPAVAESLNNLGYLLVAMRRYPEALPYYEKALAMYRRLHPDRDHPHLARGRNNLGVVLNRLGRLDDALEHHRAALAMRRRIYGDKAHPDLAQSLHNTAFVLGTAGRHEEALPYDEQALAMYRRLHPDRDHPHVAEGLNSLGFDLLALGRDAEALAPFEQALAMYDRLGSAWAEIASESEALDFLATQPRTRDGYLTAARGVEGSNPKVYSLLWDGRAPLTRLLRRRHNAALVALDGSAELKTAWAELSDARRRLAHHLLEAGGDDQARELTRRKEELERKVVELLPDLGEPSPTRTAPAELAAALPDGSAFVDLIRYLDYTDEAAPAPHYLAFVLTSRGQPVRVDLGRAAPIERAVADWRRAVTDPDGVPSAARRSAGELRRAVWEPIRERLSDDTRVVYLCPDGALARLPFAALPGEKDDTVLLERYAFARVMHGPQLLRMLTEPAADGGGGLLALGGLDYGGGEHDALPGTEREMVQTCQLWKGARETEPTRLTGAGATPEAFRDRLSKARFAHLGTHGFFLAEQFAEEKRRTARHLEGYTYRAGQTSAAVGLGIRNPAAYVGLVLSGGETVTGEGILDLDLRGLRLVVLSACDTGLGESTENEAVAGLVRAFHVAGCRDVIASLWQVDDDATAALMAKFYHELWVNEKPAVEALRQAQLTVYRHPERVRTLARSRGFEFDQSVKRPAGESATAGKTTPPKYWAAFTLSGVGR